MICEGLPVLVNLPSGAQTAVKFWPETPSVVAQGAITVWPAITLLVLLIVSRVMELAVKQQQPSGRVADVLILAFTVYAIYCLL